jgi:hypothetical protein
MPSTTTPSSSGVDMSIREEKKEDSRVAIAAKMIVFDKDGTYQVAKMASAGRRYLLPISCADSHFVFL